MKKRNLLFLFSLFLIFSLLLVACGGSSEPTTDTEATTDTTTPEESTEESSEETTEESTEPSAEFVGTSVAAESCDYGGKISSIEAVDELTVVFTLCKADPAFLAKVAFIPFSIQPAEWIAQASASGELLEHPIGTGPYALQSWERGDSIVLTRFDGYWGEAAKEQTAVVRWATEGATRLLELQAGTADFITNLSPGDYDAVQSDSNLVLLPNPNPNILYVGMTNTFEPFNNLDVRKALALGIDRQRIVDNFFPAGSQVADYFTPCTIPNGCEGEAWYEYDVEAARQLLADAGYADGFETNIYYRNVFRVYLPEPSQVAVELQTQLQENLGITANVVEMESGAFIAESSAGNLDGIYLLGWGADYPHVTNFLDYHFSPENMQFGTPHPEIYEPLKEGSSVGDIAAAAPFYEQVNNSIRELVPVVPIAHGASADAASVSVDGAYVPPFGSTNLASLGTGKGTLVYVQSAEPISLYCADETDGESLRLCEQILEPLLTYKKDSGETEGALATGCEGNDDSTVWTCSLRSGVTFHDGSSFDANDVVASWAAGIDAANPYHIGNTGIFEYYSYLWDGLINAEE